MTVERRESGETTPPFVERFRCLAKIYSLMTTETAIKGSAGIYDAIHPQEGCQPLDEEYRAITQLQLDLPRRLALAEKNGALSSQAASLREDLQQAEQLRHELVDHEAIILESLATKLGFSNEEITAVDWRALGSQTVNIRILAELRNSAKTTEQLTDYVVQIIEASKHGGVVYYYAFQEAQKQLSQRRALEKISNSLSSLPQHARKTLNHWRQNPEKAVVQLGTAAAVATTTYFAAPIVADLFNSDNNDNQVTSNDTLNKSQTLLLESGAVNALSFLNSNAYADGPNPGEPCGPYTVVGGQATNQVTGEKLVCSDAGRWIIDTQALHPGDTFFNYIDQHGSLYFNANSWGDLENELRQMGLTLPESQTRSEFNTSTGYNFCYGLAFGLRADKINKYPNGVYIYFIGTMIDCATGESDPNKVNPAGNPNADEVRNNNRSNEFIYSDSQGSVYSLDEETLAERGQDSGNVNVVSEVEKQTVCEEVRFGESGEIIEKSGCRIETVSSGNEFVVSNRQRGGETVVEGQRAETKSATQITSREGFYVQFVKPNGPLVAVPVEPGIFQRIHNTWRDLEELNRQARESYELNQQTIALEKQLKEDERVSQCDSSIPAHKRPLRCLAE
jgi:hypothetical protein